MVRLWYGIRRATGVEWIAVKLARRRRAAIAELLELRRSVDL